VVNINVVIKDVMIACSMLAVIVYYGLISNIGYLLLARMLAGA